MNNFNKCMLLNHFKNYVLFREQNYVYDRS